MPAIAIVGAGPRGISVIERLAAHLRTHATTPAVDLHIIEDTQHGSGRIWDTRQTHTLCMNTLAGAVSLFTEPESTMTAPVLEGPTMYQWVRLLRGEKGGIGKPTLETFRRNPVHPAVMEEFGPEISATRPESNPSRALYGAYLRWVREVALAQLPSSVRAHHHHARVVDIAESGQADVLTLSDDSAITAHATVLASGWQVPALTETERELTRAAESGLEWIRPNNPVEQQVDRLPAGEEILVRGLGMGFFDLMALVTVERGGRFIPDNAARSGLRYEASGREPRLVVASGRGYPYLPKSEYGGLPPRAQLERFRSALPALGEEIDFGREVLPHILRDAYAEYYATQARVRPAELRVGLEEIKDRIDAVNFGATSLVGMADELRDALAGVSEDLLDLGFWANPLARHADGGVQEFITSGMQRDITEAVAASDSPLKSALWAISAARKPASIAGSEGRLTWESRTGTYREFMAFGQMVGSGPPLFRTRQLLALADAGLVTFLGDKPQLSWDEKGFCLRTAHGERASRYLVDAWMHQPDVRRPADPLALALRERTRPFADHGHPTGSPETTWRRRVVHPDGGIDKRLHIVGIPTYAQWPDTTISPMPGTDPLMLQETDRTAGSLLEAALGN